MEFDSAKPDRSHLEWIAMFHLRHNIANEPRATPTRLHRTVGASAPFAC